MIIFDNVTYIYNKDTPMQRTAIKGVSLTICTGEFVAVMGGAGSGKSTFLQLLGGLLKPTGGIIDTSPSGRVMGSNSVGVVFQFPERQFFENTVYADLSFPLRRSEVPEYDIEERLNSALRKVNLDFNAYSDRAPLELSSGEKRRIAIASMLVLDPALIALDEPFAGLDNKGRKDVYYELKRLCKETGKGVIIATQDLETVSEGCERFILLDKGSISGDGPLNLLKDRLAPTSPISSLANSLKSKGIDLGEGICNAGDAFMRIKRVAGKGKSC